jgi:hypothetical protein
VGISALLSTQILDSSSTGRAVLTGADASAIRTVLGLGNVENAAASGLYVALTGAQTVAGVKTFSNSISTLGAITLSPTSVASASSATWLSVNSTYNQTGTAGSIDFKLNRTETALGSGSHLFADFQVNSVSQFRVDRAGNVTASGSLTLGSDTILLRDAANTLAQRNVANAQRFNLYGTYTDASNYRRLYSTMTTGGAATIGVEGLGTGASGNTLSIANDVTFAGIATAQDSIRVGTATTNAPWMFPFDASGYTTQTVAGRGLSFYSKVVVADGTGFAFTGNSFTQTSGQNIGVQLAIGYSPSSGTGSFNSVRIQPTINQTGGANGTTRSLYVIPTITAAADHRSIEVGDAGSHFAIRTGTGKIQFGDSVTINGNLTITGTSNISGGGLSRYTAIALGW